MKVSFIKFLTVIFLCGCYNFSIADNLAPLSFFTKEENGLKVKLQLQIKMLKDKILKEIEGISIDEITKARNIESLPLRTSRTVDWMSLALNMQGTSGKITQIHSVTPVVMQQLHRDSPKIPVPVQSDSAANVEINNLLVAARWRIENSDEVKAIVSLISPYLSNKIKRQKNHIEVIDMVLRQMIAGMNHHKYSLHMKNQYANIILTTILDDLLLSVRKTSTSGINTPIRIVSQISA